METALVSGALAAIVAALGGLTILAVKNPTGYHSFSDRILRWLSLGLAVLGTWWFAMFVAEVNLEPFIDYDRREEAHEFIGYLTFPFWWLVVIGASGGYLILLQNLPGLLGEKNEKNKKE